VVSGTSLPASYVEKVLIRRRRGLDCASMDATMDVGRAEEVFVMAF